MLIAILLAILSASLWGCELKYSKNRIFFIDESQPPCEAVNWNLPAWACQIVGRGQPPCEAVNWNKFAILSPRFWLCQPPCEAVNWNICSIFVACSLSVSLLVRLWIEICLLLLFHCSSLVSLLVRLWIEICDSHEAVVREWLSASLWGCELKY